MADRFGVCSRCKEWHRLAANGYCFSNNCAKTPFPSAVPIQDGVVKDKPKARVCQRLSTSKSAG